MLLGLVSADFVAKLLTSGILFSTAVNADFVANPLTLDILFSTVANIVFVAKLLMSVTLPFISIILE